MLKRLVCTGTLLSSVFAQAGLLALDDGSVNAFGGTDNGDLLALNHFDVGDTPIVIDEIRVLWNPLSRSMSPAVALYADPNGDGNPSDMIPLEIQQIFIQPNVVILNNSTVQSYPISPTLVSGSFFVGAYLSDRASSLNPVIGVDLAHLAPLQSWIIENSTGMLDLMDPIGTSNLRTPLDTYIAGNHMIQAHFVPVPEPSAGVVAALGLSCWLIRTVGRRPIASKKVTSAQ